MGRPRKRMWGPSPLATAVDIVGGIPWAVAISGMTLEGLTVALQRGHLINGPAAVRLSRATQERKRPVPVEALVGLDDKPTAKTRTVAA